MQTLYKHKIYIYNLIHKFSKSTHNEGFATPTQKSRAMATAHAHCPSRCTLKALQLPLKHQTFAATTVTTAHKHCRRWQRGRRRLRFILEGRIHNDWIWLVDTTVCIFNHPFPVFQTPLDSCCAHQNEEHSTKYHLNDILWNVQFFHKLSKELYIKLSSIHFANFWSFSPRIF